METKKLEILKNSLLKKELLFSEKLQNHIDTVKMANGQPMNDKRNGQATLNKWNKQNDSLRSLNGSIEKTEKAIEIEEGKIFEVEAAKESLPVEILALIESKELTQWRRHPNIFFVNGVDKARIVWDNKKKVIAHKFISEVTDKEQRSKFAKVFNALHILINPPIA